MNKPKRKVNKLIIHCTATPEGREHTVADIRQWHIKRGFNDIGYHFVINIAGELLTGRDIEKIGAHTKGQNTGSIGISYVGGLDHNLEPKDTRTPEQIKTLKSFCHEFISLYPEGKIYGHYDFANKACPCFDVQKWLQSVTKKAI